MTPMKQRAAVGSQWRRRRDKTLWQIRQSHRKDRMAELVPDSQALPVAVGKVFVSFDDLRVRFEEVGT